MFRMAPIGGEEKDLREVIVVDFTNCLNERAADLDWLGWGLDQMARPTVVAASLKLILELLSQSSQPVQSQ